MTLLYRLFDLVVESEIPLLDFEQISEAVPALSVKRSEDRFDFPADLVWTDVWSNVWSAEAGTRTRPRPVWRVAWDGEDLLLTISKCGEFRFENGFRTVSCYPYSKTSDHAVQTQLSYNLLPRVLVELGQLVVHASCVSLDEGVSVLFMGSSGAGKSTLAASFDGNGGTFLSDDCVLLRADGGHLVADVTGGAARLWDDSLHYLVGENHDATLVGRTPGASKWRHRTRRGQAPPTSTRIGAIFWLPVGRSDTVCDGVAIAEETRFHLLSVLTEATLTFGLSDRRDKGRRFLTAADIANVCPAFYSLRYPRMFDSLPAVRRAVVSRIGAASPSGSPAFLACCDSSRS